jgi:hypothetical protein
MKKVLLFALVLLIGIAFVSTGFAQDKAKPAPAADTAKPAAEKPKAKPMSGFVGKVTVTDSVYKSVSVQKGKNVVTFDVADAKFKGYKAADDITVGDTIAMKYDKKGALAVTKIAGAKKAKAAVAKPKKEKKDEAAVGEQKPADEKIPAKKAKKAAPKKEEKKEEAK